MNQGPEHLEHVTDNQNMMPTLEDLNGFEEIRRKGASTQELQDYCKLHKIPCEKNFDIPVVNGYRESFEKYCNDNKLPINAEILAINKTILALLNDEKWEAKFEHNKLDKQEGLLSALKELKASGALMDIACKSDVDMSLKTTALKYIIGLDDFDEGVEERAYTLFLNAENVKIKGLAFCLLFVMGDGRAVENLEAGLHLICDNYLEDEVCWEKAIKLYTTADQEKIYLKFQNAVFKSGARRLGDIFCLLYPDKFMEGLNSLLQGEQFGGYRLCEALKAMKSALQIQPTLPETLSLLELRKLIIPRYHHEVRKNDLSDDVVNYLIDIMGSVYCTALKEEKDQAFLILKQNYLGINYGRRKQATRSMGTLNDANAIPLLIQGCDSMFYEYAGCECYERGALVKLNKSYPEIVRKCIIDKF